METDVQTGQANAAAPLTGAILAGGQNRRMGGRSKALLAVEGETFLQRQVKEMSGVCSDILLLTQNASLYAEELAALREEGIAVRVVPDLVPARGPLGGLQSALHASSSDLLWVVGCDMPFVSSQAAAELAAVCLHTDAAAAVPCIAGRIHPLHGVYRKKILPLAERMLEAGDYRMMGVLHLTSWEPVDEVVWNRLGIRTDFVRNINTPDEYQELLRERSSF
ncbi:molybdenum cofactor guanylyltransferase [Paenibacillus mucilaginosus]|uniref:Probable molybdenum cofactor guanylyltransferase n=1 Tax=Paenibacillus mucilaginosus (strain KNP414) TaxID=1036673 RepID=F8FBA2_PAEMK|nr:molybdenum cofactor guanylyltransferase [Paenibacillus mucilaginosus]AEI42069.1 formate dehydrogenase family accessory protein FdhD [Paenibacillus mucilaginosus KNP414]MCG7214055.1 molybdenum cofactor guanylyltransferase [Paenibacillus mucilaginosus]WDM28579.1 molybdenum cofactor guanylyltransferase [Paenibacillus mucilaginosus]